MFFGVSTGETGQYGVGDIVTGSNWTKTNDGYELDGEPCYNVFTIENGVPKYVD